MQAFAALREVKTGVEKIRVLRENSKKEALDYLIVHCKVPKEIQPRIEQGLSGSLPLQNNLHEAIARSSFDDCVVPLQFFSISFRRIATEISKQSIALTTP
jgi:hypothetical protein